MILSLNTKGDVISDYFLMLWFQKDSQDPVGFRTFRSGVPKIKSWILVDQSDIWIPKYTEGGGGTGLGLFPKFDHFLRLPLS